MLKSWQEIIIGIQLLFVAFGALVLVPLLTGLDPAIALFTAGIGTLIFHGITKNSVPIFLASSFAFIAPIQMGIKTFGLGATLGGLASAGLLYILLGVLVKLRGVEVIEKYLPAVVTGPVIMVIGLKLAPVAIGMTKNFGEGNQIDPLAILVAMVSLAVTVLVVLSKRKFLSLIPILIGIFAGYLLSVILGKVDFTMIKNAPWFAIPWREASKHGAFEMVRFHLPAILYILPVAIAPAIEHVGDIIAIGSVAGKDYLEKPGLHRTLMGDGVATTVASLLGGPPNTTYSEVTGAVALLKQYKPKLMIIASFAAIILAFWAKLGALLKTIPQPVMGGILVLLFGMIASVGIRSLIHHKVNLDNPRNMVIVAIILVFGIGDMVLGIGNFQLAGIGLAGITGVILNIILPNTKPNQEETE